MQYVGKSAIFFLIVMTVKLHAKFMVISHISSDGSGETQNQVSNVHHCKYLKITFKTVFRDAKIEIRCKDL